MRSMLLLLASLMLLGCGVGPMPQGLIERPYDGIVQPVSHPVLLRYQPVQRMITTTRIASYRGLSSFGVSSDSEIRSDDSVGSVVGAPNLLAYESRLISYTSARQTVHGGVTRGLMTTAGVFNDFNVVVDDVAPADRERVDSFLRMQHEGVRYGTLPDRLISTGDQISSIDILNPWARELMSLPSNAHLIATSVLRGQTNCQGRPALYITRSGSGENVAGRVSGWSVIDAATGWALRSFLSHEIIDPSGRRWLTAVDSRTDLQVQ